MTFIFLRWTAHKDPKMKMAWILLVLLPRKISKLIMKLIMLQWSSNQAEEALKKCPSQKWQTTELTGCAGRIRFPPPRLCSTNMVDILCFKFYYVYAPHIFNILPLSCWQEGTSASLKSTKDKTTKINISLSGISWCEMNLPNPALTLIFFFPQNSLDGAVFKGYAAGLSHPAQWVADWLLMQFSLVPAVYVPVP